MTYELIPEPDFSERKNQTKIQNLFAFGKYGEIRFGAKGYAVDNIVFRNIIYYVAFSEEDRFVADNVIDWSIQNSDLLIELNLLPVKEYISRMKFSEQKNKEILSKAEHIIRKVTTLNYKPNYLTVLKMLVWEKFITCQMRPREMGGFYYLFHTTDDAKMLRMMINMKKAIR